MRGGMLPSLQEDRAHGQSLGDELLHVAGTGHAHAEMIDGLSDQLAPSRSARAPNPQHEGVVGAGCLEQGKIVGSSVGGLEPEDLGIERHRSGDVGDVEFDVLNAERTHHKPRGDTEPLDDGETVDSGGGWSVCMPACCTAVLTPG